MSSLTQGKTDSSQYRLTFTSDKDFEAFKSALNADMQAMGFSDPKVHVNDKHKSIDLDYSYFELLVYFQGEDKQVGKLWPLSWQHQVPTQEELARQSVAGPCKVERVHGDIMHECQQRDQQAKELFTQWPDEARSQPAINAMKNNAITRDTIGKQKSLVVGEWHVNQSPRKFLIDQMNELANSNTPLVLEHVFASQQPLIDSWLKAPADAPMPGELKQMVEFFSEQFDISSRKAGGPDSGANSFVELLKAAKDAGVKVVAIEDEISMLSMEIGKLSPSWLEGLENKGDYERFALMNVNAYEQAMPYIEQGKPTALLVGAAHAVDHHDKATGDFVPGLDRMTGGASVILGDDISMYPAMPKDVYKAFEALADKADGADITRLPSASAPAVQQDAPSHSQKLQNGKGPGASGAGKY